MNQQQIIKSALSTGASYSGYASQYPQGPKTGIDFLLHCQGGTCFPACTPKCYGIPGYGAFDGNYSNLFGGYPPTLGKDGKACKSECRDTKGLKWGQGGKECYRACKAQGGDETQTQFEAAMLDVMAGAGEGEKGSAGLYIGLAAGAALLIAGSVILIRRGRNRAAIKQLATNKTTAA